MALQGTLEDFGIADIFQLIGQQQKTGILELNRKESTVHIHFHEGNIVSAEVLNRDKAERLGQMMIEAGLLIPENLHLALSIQKKTLQKLGAILIEQQLIKKSELDEFIYLQTKETIFKLFRWNSGTYQFHQQEVSQNSEFFQPINAEHILMDGFRIIDEWPGIRKKIGNFSNIYERVPGKMIPSASGESEMDRDLDQAFAGFEGGDAPAPGGAEPLTPNCERLFDLVDGKKDVRTLIAFSRLGEFEASHAVVTLLDQGWIRVGATGGDEGDGEEGSERRSIDLFQDYQSPRSRWLETLPNVAAYGVYILAFLLLLGYLEIGPLRGFFATQNQRIEGNVFRETMSDYQMDRLRVALDIYYLEKGYYPKDLHDLVTSDLLKEADLHVPWEQIYIYRSDGASYELEKPFF